MNMSDRDNGVRSLYFVQFSNSPLSLLQLLLPAIIRCQPAALKAGDVLKGTR